MGVVHQKHEDVAIAGVERGRIFGHIDKRVVGHGRPVQHAGDLPSRVAGAISGNFLHSGDQLVIPNTAIIWAGDGAKFDSAIVRLQCFHEFRTVGEQTMLKVDCGQWGRKIAQIAGRRAD